MKRGTGYLVMVDVLIAVIVGILVFQIWYYPSSSFWTGYVMLILAVLFQNIPLLLSAKKNVDTVYRIMLFTFSGIYLFAQAVISMWGFFTMTEDSGKIFAFGVTAFLAYMMLFFCYIFITRSGTVHASLEDRKRIEGFLANLTIYKNCVKEKEIFDELEKLIEKLRYSNVSDSGVVLQIENRMQENIMSIGRTLEEGRYSDTKTELWKLERLISERNQACKVNQ